MNKNKVGASSSKVPSTPNPHITNPLPQVANAGTGTDTGILLPTSNPLPQEASNAGTETGTQLPTPALAPAPNPDHVNKNLQNSLKSIKPWEPCCCDGTLKCWSVFVGIYEILLWAVMIATNALYSIAISDSSYLSIGIYAEFITKLEFVTFAIGVLSGCVIFTAILLKKKVLGIVHGCMSLLICFLLVAVIALSIPHRHDVFKWVAILAYIGLGAQQIYFAFFSYVLYEHLKIRELNLQSHQNTVVVSPQQPTEMTPMKPTSTSENDIKSWARTENISSSVQVAQPPSASVVQHVPTTPATPALTLAVPTPTKSK